MTYDAISPTRPELSVAGKVIVVSGGGAGIGRETVRSFARAGAKDIAIFGRRAAPLEETKTSFESEFSGTKIHVFVADVTDEKAVDNVFSTVKSTIGSVDIFVANAGFLSTPATTTDTDVAEWYKSFDINVKGTLISARAFLKNASPAATLLSTNTAVMHALIPATYSAYGVSKVALAHLVSFLQVENPDFNFISFHPGVIESDMYVKSKMTLPMDDTSLPVDFAVWLASKEATWLKGKFVWCNWDVTELLAKKDGILAGNDLTLQLAGWP